MQVCAMAWMGKSQGMQLVLASCWHVQAGHIPVLSATAAKTKNKHLFAMKIWGLSTEKKKKKYRWKSARSEMKQRVELLYLDFCLFLKNRCRTHGTNPCVPPALVAGVLPSLGLSLEHSHGCSGSRCGMGGRGCLADQVAAANSRELHVRKSWL